MEVYLEDRHPRVYRRLRFIVRSLGTVNFLFGLLVFTHWQIKNDDTFSRFGYSFKYLCTWVAVVHVIYFTIWIVLDLFEVNKTKKRHDLPVKFVEYLGATFVFPGGVTVFVTFWGMSAFDSETIISKSDRANHPVLILANHMMHTSQLFFTVAESLLSPKSYPPTWKCMVGLGVFYTSYIIWFIIVFFLTERWIYPMFGQLNAISRMVYLVTGFSVLTFSFFLGKLINFLLWNFKL